MKKQILFLLVTIVIASVAVCNLVPWNDILERRIAAYLDTRGIKNISFEIDDIGLQKTTFGKIKIGYENPLVLKAVTVEYDPKEIINGRLYKLTLSELDILVRQNQEGWKIAGLEDIRSKTLSDHDSISVSELIKILPFSDVEVKDGYLHLLGENMQASLPFSLHLTKYPQTAFEITINGSKFLASEKNVSLGTIVIKAENDVQGHWSGTWTLDSLDLSDFVATPFLAGSGAVKYIDDAISFYGSLNDQKNNYKANFSTTINMNKKDENVFNISSITFPFKDGIISSKNVIVPFDLRKNIVINLNVSKVSLDAFMQALTRERVTATGTMSGTIPLVLKPDGSFSLGKGILKADQKGQIRMPAELIPGDDEQVGLVRQILNNLQYSVFSAAVDTVDGKNIIVKLSLEGNNPDVYDGRNVKLNINLTGDVLDFIQQNAILITNPEQFLEQGTR